ncbi:uncharacterized protein SCHCODRAFT_02614748 [Schizophyllum commune H4-8]|uniref:uncharacterized protein n=1 Tax=Schizophyllum commune (strain H4-8 / FGSC 9210) TaxID=578458 RepID=UPI002160830B|nr:uncharacterized protein SCHCODRAFT_02614748 [Schizophyllum commune H4-8]KAI5896400.1 hypothetical protein SCHCODRAFT_02614748 [Schizophyllum commune H4-8]
MRAPSRSRRVMEGRKGTCVRYYARRQFARSCIHLSSRPCLCITLACPTLLLALSPGPCIPCSCVNATRTSLWR